MNDQSYLTSQINIQQFHSLGSTNECAKLALKDGKTPPFWIVADEQTGGRGRHGRDWVSLKGNLFTTAVMSVNATGKSLSAMSLVSALALYDAILNSKSENQSARLKLKWPNDINANGAKLGGILIENQSSPDATRSDLIIGFGVNILSAPVIEGRDTTCLHAINNTATRNQLLNELMQSLSFWVQRFDNGNNLQEIIDCWMTRTYPIGQTLTVKIGDRHETGNYAGLNEYGALKLKQPDNTIKLITGGELI